MSQYCDEKNVFVNQKVRVNFQFRLYEKTTGNFCTMIKCQNTLTSKNAQATSLNFSNYILSKQ